MLAASSNLFSEQALMHSCYASARTQGRKCIAVGASLIVFQQVLDVEGGAATEIVPVLRKERVGRGTAFVAEEGEKGPLPVELGRGAEFGHRLGGDPMHPHRHPPIPLASTGGHGRSAAGEQAEL